MSARRDVRASAPGKVILIGEHAVVYGRPALVAAIDLRASARVSDAPGRQVELELSDLAHRERLSWLDLEQCAREARRSWEAVFDDPAGAMEPGGPRFGRDDPAFLVKVALGELAAELGAGELPPVSVRVTSAIPVGSGFGSSAAVAVAVLAAALSGLGETPERERLERLALEVERRQHGTPSGADHGTVLRGGILRVDPAPGGPPRMTPVRAASDSLQGFQVFDSGRPAESTGEVVAAVRRLRRREPRDFERLLGRMGAAVEQVERELSAGAGDGNRLCAALREFEECLERMEVVPEAVRRRIREIERLGAAAKISGAGTLSGEGAGGLLVYRPPGVRELGPALDGLVRHPVALGVEGVRLEEAA